MKKITLFSFLAFTSTLFSQTNNDPIYVNYSYFPNSKMDKIDNEATLNLIEANVILPKFDLTKTTEVYTNINYKSYMYDLEKSEEVFPDQLNDIRLGLIIRQKLAENWEMIISPRANLRTDFSDNSTKYGIFPSLNVIGIKSSKKVEKLSYGLGVSYNNDLNKNTIIPLGYLRYETEKLRINAILPSFAHVILTPTDKIEYGLSYNLDAAIFHTDKGLETNPQIYMKTSNITIAPTFGYNFSGKFWLNAKAGYAMFRRYQVLNDDFKDVAYTDDNKIKSGLFFGLGVSYRLE